MRRVVEAKMLEGELLATEPTDGQAAPAPIVVLVAALAGMLIAFPSALAWGVFTWSCLDLRWYAGAYPQPCWMGLLGGLLHTPGFIIGGRSAIALYHRGSVVPVVAVGVVASCQGVELLAALLQSIAWGIKGHALGLVPWWLAVPIGIDAFAIAAAILALPACMRLDREWRTLLPE